MAERERERERERPPRESQRTLCRRSVESLCTLTVPWSDAPKNLRVEAQKGLYSRYTSIIAVTFHSGRYREVDPRDPMPNVLGGPPIAIAVEIAGSTFQDHCGLARSTPLQRGTPHTFALTSLSTPWHSSHAAFHDHSGLPAGSSPPIAPPRRALCWPRPHGRRRATMHIHRHR